VSGTAARASLRPIRANHALPRQFDFRFRSARRHQRCVCISPSECPAEEDCALNEANSRDKFPDLNPFKYMKTVKSFALLATTLLLTVVVGCRDSSPSHGHDHGHGHDHTPPHGGTIVVIAPNQLHLELVLDSTVGKLQAYVLDGHYGESLVIPETSFILVAQMDGKEETLTLQRAPEKSSLFEAQADWLKTVKEFEGHIPTITLKGATFTNLKFFYPKSSTHVH
jgi:hypothetical protein